ncbi:hypothetical protein [Candidatus Nitrosacidococcus tergens]|uniref:Uncharacterized protein n=1 Tax=Candidatus Nitrosacidococcus tergens TaxID=553981 RepID=A0A7G1Q7F2_9GAMM|nr:hypothetical protein [Candidatus Nitrosacidococcus tergens]CAB1274472.1 protein of unknown function [Candidatus Nitrosacidococcus tergens]
MFLIIIKPQLNLVIKRTLGTHTVVILAIATGMFTAVDKTLRISFYSLIPTLTNPFPLFS